jgi:hypothetical protein
VCSKCTSQRGWCRSTKGTSFTLDVIFKTRYVNMIINGDNCANVVLLLLRNWIWILYSILSHIDCSGLMNVVRWKSLNKCWFPSLLVVILTMLCVMWFQYMLITYVRVSDSLIGSLFMMNLEIYIHYCKRW